MLAELCPTGVLLISAQGHQVSSNQAWRDILGLSDTDDLDDAWLDIVHPDDREEVKWNLTHRLEGDAPLEQSFRFVRADDARVREGRGSFHLLHDRDGRVCGAIGSLQDVTQELEAEQEHRRLLQILEETSDCVLLMARDARILQANAAARRTFGDEIVGSLADRIMTVEARRRIFAEGIPLVDAGVTHRGVAVHARIPSVLCGLFGHEPSRAWNVSWVTNNAIFVRWVAATNWLPGSQWAETCFRDTASGSAVAVPGWYPVLCRCQAQVRNPPSTQTESSITRKSDDRIYAIFAEGGDSIFCIYRCFSVGRTLIDSFPKPHSMR